MQRFLFVIHWGKYKVYGGIFVTQRFKQVILVCDMDGTLLNGEDTISIETQEALRYFTEKGGLFTVATGRKEVSMKRFMEELPINLPAILYNGSIIYDLSNDRVLWERQLECNLGDLLSEVRRRFPSVGIEIYKDNTIKLVHKNSYTEFHRQIEHYPDELYRVQDISLPWRKVLLADDPEQLTELEKFIESYYADREAPFRMCRSERFFLEWLPIGVSKGSALEALKSMYGLEQSMVVTVGNETNDIEMLSRPNIGFAVDNAHPEAKRAAPYQCTDHNQNPVRDIIKWIENQL